MPRYAGYLLALVLICPWAQGAQRLAPQKPLKSPGPASFQFRHFKELQAHILNIIGSAQKSVVLITDFLTDGEISSALYLAKYRKIKVEVFLGSNRVNKYLSRVNFLKQQGIKVSLRPQLPLSDPSLLLVDHQLYRITRDLDVLRPEVSGQLVLASPKLTNLMVRSLSNPKNNVKITTRPYPKVGRARNHYRQKRWTKPYTGSNDGSYNYDRARIQKRPENVPTDLPKIPKYQQEPEPEPEAETNAPEDDGVFDREADDGNKIPLTPPDRSNLDQDEPLLEDD